MKKLIIRILEAKLEACEKHCEIKGEVIKEMGEEMQNIKEWNIKICKKKDQKIKDLESQLETLDTMGKENGNDKT